MANREKALGILAVAAVVAYALACRPAWNPDSSQVAFPFADEDAKVWGVATYDVKVKECRRIYETRESVAIQAVWLPSGESVIVLVHQDKKLDVVRLDPKNGSHKVLKSITDAGDMPVEPSPLLAPVVSQGRYLWLIAEKKGTEKVHGLLKIDSPTGETEFVRTAGSTFLAQNGNNYAYTAELPGDPKGVEVGTFDPAQGRLRKIRTFGGDEAGDQEGPLVGVNHDASRFVLASCKEP